MQQPTLVQQTIGAYTIAFVCKFILLSIGVCLLLPMDTFGAASSGYRVLIATGIPEPVWGLYFFALGLAGIVSLRRGNPTLRMTLGVIGGSTFVGLAVMFLIANIAGLIAWVLIPLALLDFFSLPYLQRGLS